MTRDTYSQEDYSRPHLPPATPPVIDAAAHPQDAARITRADGDSDFAGRNLSSFDRSAEDEALAATTPGKGDDITPDRSPDEIVPDKGDQIQPAAPAEIEIEREDVDEPGKGPAELPPETLPPPD